jgi:uncharacterized membrane protein
MEVPEPRSARKSRLLDPFRRAVLRGLAILLPPLLTIVIFVWVGNTVAVYLLDPLESGARRVLLAHYQKQTLPASATPDEQLSDTVARFGESAYRKLADGRWVLDEHYQQVRQLDAASKRPETSAEMYATYVQRKYLQRHVVVPIFLVIFLLTLYLLGKFLAAGMGRFFWVQFERVISRLPLVRNVYSSVKQVTDFMFSERQIEYTRVVAVEYPRKGIWSLAMVTSESMLDIRSAANEPVLAVLIPTSPMPFTGFTITVKKSETIDLNITMDQAFQFIVSCGVVVPPHQMTKAIAEHQANAENRAARLLATDFEV